MARDRVRPEQLGERGEAEPLGPTGQQPAGQGQRVDGGRCDSHPGRRRGRPLEEREVEAQVVVGEDRLARVLALFRLEFADPAVMRADIAGRPVYLGMARDAADRLRLKPQNLLVNLPLAARA